ncbi:hypothetical protein SAMN05444955_11821 [Lihuaxuella thermophila]|uniref:Uncharacterized protein n=1 Tax=Lihuaxuella thermophila TaxID=1173111 RepID=A0A1H8IL81_9BACL|nr:hypothetical protein SAMN05444955_11821 [Lihuaxuella thermophila]
MTFSMDHQVFSPDNFATWISAKKVSHCDNLSEIGVGLPIKDVSTMTQVQIRMLDLSYSLILHLFAGSPLSGRRTHPLSIGFLPFSTQFSNCSKASR